MKVEKIAAKLRAKRQKYVEPALNPENYVSTGSTVLNVAITGRTDCGFGKGRYFQFVGDSSSGKSFLCLTCLAEAANNPAFDDYELIFDDAENGVGFPFEKFFGSKAAGRIIPPSGDKDDPGYSVTTMNFYDRLHGILKAGRKVIYVLDSMDVLIPSNDEEVYAKQKAARRKGKEGPGNMGMQKGKDNSQNLRRMIPLLRQTGSILVVVSQTRDQPQTGFTPPGADTRTSGGGRALKFYGNMQLWTRIKTHLYTEKAVKGKKREQGIVAEVRLKKNRESGRDRTVHVPIYHSFGLDDTGGCIDYLVSENHWKESDGTIIATDFALKGTRDQLARKLEEAGKVKKLRLLVKKVFNEIESQCAVVRRPRYE